MFVQFKIQSTKRNEVPVLRQKESRWTLYTGKGGRRSCSQLLSRLQRHTQANVALNLSVWKSFCIASRFFFHSYPVTSIMNLNLALWYVLGGYASREADWDQRIRWTCIKILLAFILHICPCYSYPKPTSNANYIL